MESLKQSIVILLAVLILVVPYLWNRLGFIYGNKKNKNK
jgi:hypothetical protein